MSTTINARARGLVIPGIRQFSNQLAFYPNAVNLTVGQPDFPTPPSVKEAGIRAIVSDQTGYSHNAGLPELRRAIRDFFADQYGLDYNPETEIIVTNGASEAIDSVFRTILEEGDEVILPAPLYSGYEPIITMCGAKVIYLDTSITQFRPSPERLESLITDKTKAVLFNYPSNPTGVTLSREEMDELAMVMKRHDVFIISDEIYSENAFEDSHHSFAAYEYLKDRLFLIHGLSKSHSMTGWRIGFVLGPESIMDHVVKVHIYNVVCASVPGQYAAIEALTNNRHVPSEMNIAYKKRRDFVCKRLVEMGFDVVVPKGAFYIFPSIKHLNLSSMEFATRLLEEGGVAVVPGSAFTHLGEGYIRISFAYSMEVLEKGLCRIENWINQYQIKEVIS
ncbi:aminotransferase class I/II-fold pyridoxal phosphate-dependent enzyme [Rossellomorea sp. DA94]|uniref:aminotransferase class I/II-fold pyridoxal phosphate-dependent enzyme n=1 Tax=Rossellomorea sp. DA94 TaxID=3038653 RepID=UPI00244B7562|nr:aminotransferase class I/II-fold pyridoxal phosphate-dependent enzyme [Rossellomorea sp. DA94]WGG46514.1 aminotransferase class I/II-fold pyridoxal phosphate-dependent enzyme [Rossellomorea sp. DA94]